ncbi:MAG: pesticidal protein Cry5Ba [Sulfuricurvum sp.]|jgi:ech hydrogenase subunit A|uniref:proton-conducting transporter transmembrane domain-containing protein n=1 Tax=Sulfuricurvum sp. TaxID=2025608 RepID=UPI0025F39D79|nr:proton-conducting transporter membrane subunit [Sulfuricurvum sp.]MCK9374263.1 pesticidal protein Cry5Ba [Sulfuricurvum sp.]
MDLVWILVLLPIVASAALVSITSERVHYYLCSAVLILSGGTALTLYGSPEIFTFHLSSVAEGGIVVADVLLLLYFAYQGVKFKSRMVMILAVMQLLLYLFAKLISPVETAPEIVVDTLSKFMFLIINIVGGIIILFSIRYMKDESADPFKKRVFIAGLLFFLSVMNAIVCADSMLLFFLLFEMTTLSSYLLIAFRNDEISRSNALRALWMNQIGGVVILLGALVAISGFDTLSISELLEHSGQMVVLSVALLSMAALVKGASIPFDGWLLGAMVAPTPVSAMLHSATMVKIAPYLILKLSPALGGTLLGEFLSVIGASVFVAASYLALSRFVFKEILGYSTIALLGLMISLAAIGTESSISIAMVLILFHALSKALLFLAAGVLEKQYHVKSIEEMKGMIQRAPKTVGYIVFGFVSLTLPPFGLFMGKLFAITSVTSILHERPWLLIVLLGMIVGSVLLVLLYFKVASALLSHPSDTVLTKREHLPFGYHIPLILLSFLILFTAVGYTLVQNDRLLALFALPLLIVFLLPIMIRAMERYDRIQPYHCGEKESFDAALVYFEPSVFTQRLIYWGFGAMFVALLLAGALS